jgi:Homeodomain-like domain
VIRYRRALMVLASAGDNSVPVIARLVAAGHRAEVIGRFNEPAMRALDPRWAGGRPRRISAEDEAFLVATASSRPPRLGRPFTHWSLRKLGDHLADKPARRALPAGRGLRSARGGSPRRWGPSLGAPCRRRGAGSTVVEEPGQLALGLVKELARR